jgi:hypothetical protein
VKSSQPVHGDRDLVAGLEEDGRFLADTYAGRLCYLLVLPCPVKNEYVEVTYRSRRQDITGL